jgi:hypothetical protein
MISTHFLIGGIIAIGVIVALAIAIPLAMAPENEFQKDADAPEPQVLQKIDANNVTPEQIDQLIDSFDNCDLVKQEIFYEDYEMMGEIIGQEGDKCLFTLTLTNAPGLQAFAVGSNANCKLSRSEIDLLQSGDMNIVDLDCSGPLYDLASGFMN